VAATKRLNEVMSAHPESKSDFLPILEQLRGLSMRAISQRARSSGAPPPQALVDGADSDNYDQNTHEMRQKDMTDLTRQEVDAKLAASEAKADGRLANFDTSIKTGFAELRAEMADMRAEAHKSTGDIIKWGIVTALGFATATVAILTFMINNAGPKQPAAQQAPIVITVPGAVVAPAAPPSLKSNPAAPQ
jgi:hypothetical protein